MSSGTGHRPPRRGRSPAASPSSSRDTVIISHAVEDNEFARWLALQLAGCGYRVWCDLTKLLGGENFWADIERVIRQRAVKFLYVLSRVSNSDEQRGFRKELHIADTEARGNGIRDFIIPLAIDDLPSSEYNVYLALRQAVDFRAGWSRGVFTLLQKLQKHHVPKRLKRFNADAVTAWWQQYRSAVSGMQRRPDEYLSNWFPIQRLPATLHLHTLADTRAGRPILDLDFPYPGFWHDEVFVTFAPASECEGRLGSSATITGTVAVPVDCIISNSLSGHSLDVRKGRYLLVRLLKEAWDLWIEKNQALGSFETANHARASFFLKPAEGDTLKAWYLGVDGGRNWRGLTGFWSRTSKRTGTTRSRRWHFAFDARPRLWPDPVYFVTSHVVFSDDGKTLWSEPRKMHRARRNQCKDWYNEKWRDHLLAAMSFLALEAEHVELPVAESESIFVSVQPTRFQSKLTFEVVKENLEAFRQAEAFDKEDEEKEESDFEQPEGGGVDEW